tara:strand:- start:2648 stop:3223 length:576 start_codon:yes stop_codon:yes gene_type:complete
MIQKIKDLLKIKEHIDEIAKAIESNKESINSLTASIDKLKSESSELKERINNAVEEQNNFASSFRKNSEVIEELREKLENDISDFRRIKNQLPEKVFNQINDELNPHLEGLRGNVKTSDELKSEIGNTSRDVKELNSELNKFIQISRNIREADFELAKYAETLEKNDGEKLALMRTIDSLKSLIAKERRRR